MNKEKIKVEIYTNADRAFEDIAEEILKDSDKKEIVNILKRNFDLEDSLLELENLQEEIERLNNDLGDMTKLFAKEREETNRLNNIINEAIEYIEENFDKTGERVSGSDLPYFYIEELLEILDKENK